MIRKYTKAGNPYDEPPYTVEEEEWLDRLMDGGDGPITVFFSGPAGDRYKAPSATKAEAA